MPKRTLETSPIMLERDLLSMPKRTREKSPIMLERDLLTDACFRGNKAAVKYNDNSDDSDLLESDEKEVRLSESQ